MENKISNIIIGSAIEVHNTLGGPGLLEGIYEASLCLEIAKRGLVVQRQVIIPVSYKGTVLKETMCIDLLIEGQVIVEVKATEENHSIHQAQLLTYLRLTGLKLGLLINFGKTYVKDGLFRVVNKLED